jgi:hypothetical protein
VIFPAAVLVQASRPVTRKAQLKNDPIAPMLLQEVERVLLVYVRAVYQEIRDLILKEIPAGDLAKR